MNRRTVLKNILAGVAARPVVRAASGTKPNIILCMSDDQGWGDVGYNGHPYVRTPNLDAMSRAGIRFDRFYSGAPVCSPTRGSALTGRHPYRYGIYFANVGHIRKQEVTLAEALKTQGLRYGPLRQMASWDTRQRHRRRPARGQTERTLFATLGERLRRVFRDRAGRADLGPDEEPAVPYEVLDRAR